MVSKTTGEFVPELIPIEELRRRTKTPSSLHAGAMAAVGWRPGKIVTATSYNAAIKLFKSGVAGGSVNYVE